MEPNKLDKEFREKLEGRTLQPSAMAWDRLDAMLSVTEEKKKSPRHTWLYMAACFLALLLAGTFFLNNESKDGINGTIKNNTGVAVEDGAKTEKETAPEHSVEPLPQQVQQNVAETVVNQPKNNKPYSITSNKAHTAIAANDSPATHKITQPEPAQEETPAGYKQALPRISVDANALLASVDGGAQSRPVSVPAPKPGIKVDSDALLSSVEGELNESFRKKAFQSVVRNFNTVKSSVAQRNHN